MLADGIQLLGELGVVHGGKQHQGFALLGIGHAHHGHGKDTVFEFECSNGQIIGIWREKTHGNLETFFYSRQDGKAAPEPAGRFFEEIRGVYALSGNTGADSMIVVMPHYAASDRKELLISKIGHGFTPSAKGEKFTPIYKGKRIVQIRHSSQGGVYRDVLTGSDQDTLNGVLWDRTIQLHPRWNRHDGLTRKMLKNNPAAPVWQGNSPVHSVEAALSPAVLHYQGPNKPWRYNHRMERRRYGDCMRRTGLDDAFPLPGFNLKDAVKRILYIPMYALARRCLARMGKQLHAREGDACGTAVHP